MLGSACDRIDGSGERTIKWEWLPCLIIDEFLSASMSDNVFHLFGKYVLFIVWWTQLLSTMVFTRYLFTLVGLAELQLTKFPMTDKSIGVVAGLDQPFACPKTGTAGHHNTTFLNGEWNMFCCKIKTINPKLLSSRSVPHSIFDRRNLDVCDFSEKQNQIQILVLWMSRCCTCWCTHRISPVGVLPLFSISPEEFILFQTVQADPQVCASNFSQSGGQKC